MRIYLMPAAALAAALVTAPAAAEDSPFEGFYAGVNAGVTWSDSQADAVFTSTPSAPVVAPPIAPGNVTAINGSEHFNSRHNTGFTGGLEAGYNYVSNHNGLLLGFESDIDIYDITGERTNTVTSGATTYSTSHKVDTSWLWSLRPRIGYAGGAFMGYLTGGIVWTNVKYKTSFTDSSTAGDNIYYSDSKSKTGWTIGAGVAYALSRNISLKGEYLFDDFGHETYNASSANGFYDLAVKEHLKSHKFRAGLDYRF